MREVPCTTAALVRTRQAAAPDTLSREERVSGRAKRGKGGKKDSQPESLGGVRDGGNRGQGTRGDLQLSVRVHRTGSR